MTTKIDYNKYSNMTRKQLLNLLSNAEKKEEKIRLETSNTRELIKFLKTKIKENLKEPKYYTLETCPAIKKIDG
ncbi:hypothetical protein [Helicobacter sp. UBA3407]|uniref:hypothetical protein n=1 Tax=Helicobacter TaxID=209 RepID=UPI00262801D3|nr:hypothetical protein [Helicobacter sp. UBA3407]